MNSILLLLKKLLVIIISNTLLGNQRLVCLSNRAFAHIKMENYGLAIIDADEILKEDSGFIKAYYRKGSAYLLLGKFDDARKEFKRVTNIINFHRLIL